MSDRRTIVITVRDEPGHQLPLAIRLRRFLKLALRVYGIRAVDIVEQTQPSKENAPCS